MKKVLFGLVIVGSFSSYAESCWNLDYGSDDRKLCESISNNSCWNLDYGSDDRKLCESIIE